MNKIGEQEMSIETDYKKLTLEETIERLNEMVGTQQPYRYNNETIYNAIIHLKCKENKEVYDKGYYDGEHDGYNSTAIENGIEEKRYNPPKEQQTEICGANGDYVYPTDVILDEPNITTSQVHIDKSRGFQGKSISDDLQKCYNCKYGANDGCKYMTKCINGISKIATYSYFEQKGD